VTVLGDPCLRRLVDELAQRMSASDRAVVRVTLRDLDQQPRVALADLLRLDHTPPATVQVDVRRLAKALHTEARVVVAVVERIRRPLGNRARARATAATVRPRHPRRNPSPCQSWPAGCSVIRTLPYADRNVGRVLRSALSVLGLDGSVREHMLKAGLADDESTVATWALPLPTNHPAAGWYEAGEIVVITSGQLRRHPIARSPGIVTLVENPSVLAVARARERDTALLCLSGQPSHAALLACDQIVAAGDSGRLALHADFDIAGLHSTPSRLLEICWWTYGDGIQT
jgi:hypothetical protein